MKEETKSQQNSLTQDHTAAFRMQDSNGMPSHSGAHAFNCLTGPLAFFQVEMLEVATGTGQNDFSNKPFYNWEIPQLPRPSSKHSFTGCKKVVLTFKDLSNFGIVLLKLEVKNQFYFFSFHYITCCYCCKPH